MLASLEKNTGVLLSIIIPVFNRQDSLNELLNVLSSAIKQGGFKQFIEIIIIDDCSQPPIALPYINSQTSLIYNQTNQGAPLSRKKGFKQAKGKFIHFHDSDDSVPSDWLSKILEELTQNPKTELLLTWRLDIEKNSKKIRTKPFFRRNVNKPNKIKNRLNYTNIIGPLGGVVFSKKSLRNVSFKNIASSQDWLMYIEVMQTAKHLNCRPDIHFIFNKTGGDRISHNPRKKILGYFQLAQTTKKLTPFNNRIRLYYLYQSRHQISKYGGRIQHFYNKNKAKIYLNYVLIKTYSFLSV